MVLTEENLTELVVLLLIAGVAKREEVLTPAVGEGDMHITTIYAGGVAAR